MHDVLANVVAREAGKLDLLSAASGTLLSESDLKALEMLARCAKCLKADPEAKTPGEKTTTEEALALVEGG